jgi:hypothetical protein
MFILFPSRDRTADSTVVAGPLAAFTTGSEAASAPPLTTKPSNPGVKIRTVFLLILLSG